MALSADLTARAAELDLEVQEMVTRRQALLGMAALAADLELRAAEGDSLKAQLVQCNADKVTLTAEVARLTQELAACQAAVPLPPPPPGPVSDIPAGTDVDASGLVAALAAAPNGAVFRVRPGTVTGATLVLKPGQQVWALDAPNTLFDGQGVQWFAKGVAAATPDTVLGYLRFKGYAPADPTWVNVQGDTYRRQGGVQGSTLPNSRLYRLEGFENGWAVQGGSGMLVENCILHHNHQMAISANARDGLTVKGGEWHNNNRRPDGRPFYNWQWEAGSSKFVKCTNLTIDRVFAHHNIGPGPWTDRANDLVTVKNCRSEDNDADGIFHEISYRAVIENNDCHRNKNAANIYISNSRGTSATDSIRIRNNRTSGHPQWEIGLSNSGARTPYLDFVAVTDNTVSGVIRKYTVGTPPAPTSIVVTGNKKPDGTVVNLT